MSDASRMPRRSVAGVLGSSAGVLTTRSGAARWLLFDSARTAYTVAPNLTKPSSGIRCQMRFCGRQFLMESHTDDLEFTWYLITAIRWARVRFGAAAASAAAPVPTLALGPVGQDSAPDRCVRSGAES